MTSWNPALYLSHQIPRLRPALDLLSQTVSFSKKGPASVEKVLDLGCGPGNLTGFLIDAFPNAQIYGVDSSAEMIQAARKSHEQLTQKVMFQLNSVESLIEEAKVSSTHPKFDVIFSNAALHWTLHHEIIFPSILRYLLNSGGVLSVQMPDTRVQPSHLLMETAAHALGYANILADVRIPRVEQSPTEYFNMLTPIAREVDIWSTEYVQQLSYASDADPHPVLQYTRATGLMPYLQALGGQDSERGQRFLARYEALLKETYPTTFARTGERVVLFPFKRFFLLCKV